MTLREQLNQATAEAIDCYHNYGHQIKICNGPNSNQLDFDLLDKLREQWRIADARISELYAQINENKQTKKQLYEATKQLYLQ